jgi:hypothetical protein
VSTIRLKLQTFTGASPSEIKERLHAALVRELRLSAWGTGGGSGFYSAQMETSWREQPLYWTLSFKDGDESVQLEVSAETATEPELSAFVNKFLLGVFDEALLGKGRSYSVRRQFTYQGPPLDGEYWISGRLRIAPHPTSTRLRRGSWVSQILVIDQTVNAVGEDHARRVASDLASSLTARLSLILDIGLMVPPREWVWASPDESATEGEWRFRTPPPAPRFLNTLPMRGECLGGQWVGRLNDRCDGGRKLSLPRETRRVLRFADAAPEKIQRAFDGCCRLYQLSHVLPHEFVSAKLAYRVAAAEALAETSEGRGGFSGFMRDRSPLIRNHPELLDTLYGKVRSALFHAGQYYFDNPTSQKLVTDFDAARRRNEEAQADAALRDAIISWVRDKVEEVEQGPRK